MTGVSRPALRLGALSLLLLAGAASSLARRPTERRQRDDVGHDCHDDDLPGQSRPRGQRPRLGTRPRDEPVGCLRLCEARLDVRRDPRALLPGTTLGPAPLSSVRVLLAQKASTTIASTTPWSVIDATGTKTRLDPGALTLKPKLALKGKALLPPLAFVGKQPLAVNGKQYRGKFVVTSDGKRVAGGGRRRARVVPERSRPVGDAVELACPRRCRRKRSPRAPTRSPT